MNRNLEPLVYSPTEVAEILHIARSRAYALLASGQVATLRHGKSVRVPVEALNEWIRKNTTPPTAE